MLGLGRSITFTFSSLECMHRIYITLVRSRLQYVFVVWNSVISTDTNKLERIQQGSAALRFNRFFPQVHYCYSLALEELKLHTLRVRRHGLDVHFLTQVYLGSKFCPSVLEILGLRVSARYIRDFTSFNVCSSCKNCSSARRASAANVVCRDVDVFDAKDVLLNHILHYVIVIIIVIIIIIIRMYKYYLFSLRNGVTNANVLILLLSPVDDNFDFHGIINIIIII
jgi:hypothetical protein